MVPSPKKPPPLSSSASSSASSASALPKTTTNLSKSISKLKSNSNSNTKLASISKSKAPQQQQRKTNKTIPTTMTTNPSSAKNKNKKTDVGRGGTTAAAIKKGTTIKGSSSLSKSQTKTKKKTLKRGGGCHGRHEGRTKNTICRTIPENFKGCTIYCKYHILDSRYKTIIQDIQKKYRQIEILKNVAQQIVTNINFFSEHASDISTMTTFPYDTLPLPLSLPLPSPSSSLPSSSKEESVLVQQQSEKSLEPSAAAAAPLLVSASASLSTSKSKSSTSTTSKSKSLLVFDQSITYLNKNFPPLKSKIKGSGEYGRHSVPRSLLHETDDIYGKLVIINYWRQLSQQKQIYLKEIMKYYYIHPTENNDRMTSIKFKIRKDTKLLTCKIELIDDEDNDNDKDKDSNSKKIKSTAGNTIIAVSCPRSYNSIGIGLKVGGEKEGEENKKEQQHSQRQRQQNSFIQAIDNLSTRVPFFNQSMFRLNKLERIVYTTVPSSSSSQEEEGKKDILFSSWNDSQSIREAFPPLRLDNDIEDGQDNEIEDVCVDSDGDDKDGKKSQPSSSSPSLSSPLSPLQQAPSLVVDRDIPYCLLLEANDNDINEKLVIVNWWRYLDGYQKPKAVQELQLFYQNPNESKKPPYKTPPYISARAATSKVAQSVDQSAVAASLLPIIKEFPPWGFRCIETTTLLAERLIQPSPDPNNNNLQRICDWIRTANIEMPKAECRAYGCAYPVVCFNGGYCCRHKLNFCPSASSYYGVRGRSGRRCGYYLLGNTYTRPFSIYTTGRNKRHSSNNARAITPAASTPVPVQTTTVKTTTTPASGDNNDVVVVMNNNTGTNTSTPIRTVKSESASSESVVKRLKPCSCGNEICEGIGYSPSMIRVDISKLSEEHKSLIWNSKELNINEKQKSQQGSQAQALSPAGGPSGTGPGSTVHVFAPWHFHPDHRVFLPDGSWKIIEFNGATVFTDPTTITPPPVNNSNNNGNSTNASSKLSEWVGLPPPTYSPKDFLNEPKMIEYVAAGRKDNLFLPAWCREYQKLEMGPKSMLEQNRDSLWDRVIELEQQVTSTSITNQTKQFQLETKIGKIQGKYDKKKHLKRKRRSAGGSAVKKENDSTVSSARKGKKRRIDNNSDDDDDDHRENHHNGNEDNDDEDSNDDDEEAEQYESRTVAALHQLHSFNHLRNFNSSHSVAPPPRQQQQQQQQPLGRHNDHFAYQQHHQR